MGRKSVKTRSARAEVLEPRRLLASNPGGGPEAVAAFVSNGTLFVLGNTTPSQDDSDCIVIDTVGSQFKVTYGPHFNGVLFPGNQTDMFFDVASVSRIEVSTYNGGDFVYIENTSGRNLTLDAGPDNDRVQLSNSSGNLGLQSAGAISLTGGGGYDVVIANDHNTLAAQTYTTTLARFDRAGWAGFSYSGDIESLSLITGKGADTVNIPSTFPDQPIDVSSAGGADTVNLGNSVNGMRSLNADVRISNTPSLTTINANSGPDTLGRGWMVDDAGFGNFDKLTGLAPATIFWNVSDVSAVNITTGQNVDTGTIASTRTTLRTDSSGGRDTVTVGAPARGGLSGILAPVTIQNSPSFSAVVIDDTGNAVSRASVVSNAGGFNTLTQTGGSAPADILFKASDTSHVTLRTGGGSDQLFVNSIGLSDAQQLFIDSTGGADDVRLGQAPAGAQNLALQKVAVNASGPTNLQIIDTGSNDADAPVLEFNAGANEQRLTGVNTSGTTFAWNPAQMATATFSTGNGARTIDVRSTRGVMYLQNAASSDNLILIGSPTSAPDLGQLLAITSSTGNTRLRIDDSATTVLRNIVIDEFEHSGASPIELNGLGSGLLTFSPTVRLLEFRAGTGVNTIRVGALRSNTSFIGSTNSDTIHFGRDDVPGSRTSEWVNAAAITSGFEYVHLNEQDRLSAGLVFEIVDSSLLRPTQSNITTLGAIELHVALPDAGATINVPTLTDGLTAVVHSGEATDYINVTHTNATGVVRVIASGAGGTGYDFIDAAVDNTGGPARVHIDAGYRGSISVRNNGIVRATGTETIFTQALSFSGDGSFDIGASAVVYDYAGASVLPLVRGDIISGRNGGAWNGPGLRSHLPMMFSNLTVGYAEAAEVLPPGTTTWRGVDVDATAVLLRATLGGDANLDGNVNLDDFTALAASFGVPARVFSQGDFTFDELVNLDDFTILAANFGGTFAAASPARATAAPAVPQQNQRTTVPSQHSGPAITKDVLAEPNSPV